MMLELNRAFKSIMAKKGINVVTLAKGLGVSCSTVSNNIGEKANPTLKMMEKYASFLDVELSEVFLIAEKIKKDSE